MARFHRDLGSSIHVIYVLATPRAMEVWPVSLKELFVDVRIRVWSHSSASSLLLCGVIRIFSR